ncbi:MAG: MBL fold metallo-hydrolase [Planctomycetota bacterium]
MFFRMFYDDDLAQASYLIGCPGSGEAIVVDGLRDIEQYLDAAALQKLKIVAAVDTHAHADFVTAVPELAARTGARAHYSAEGGPDWTPKWAAGFDAVALRDGDEIRLGGVSLVAHHTPGHTPEHLCFKVRSASAGEAMGVLTGDCVFVGDVGRPDLLEKVAGGLDTMRPAAAELHKSVNWLLGLDDHLQLWPGHGAGSACGKDMAAVPQSTIGYERRFNTMLKSAASEGEFVENVLSGQPDPPSYFARMKRISIDGPPILGSTPIPPLIAYDALPAGDVADAVVVDLRPWPEFRSGHRPGSLSAPLDEIFTTSMGSMIRPEQRVFFIGNPPQSAEAARRLVRVGIDGFGGFVEPADLPAELPGRIGEITSADLIASPDAVVLDVRKLSEHDEGHRPGTPCIAHVQLIDRLDELPEGGPLHLICKTGRRSARSAAFISRMTGREVVNVMGGFEGWKAAGGEIEK